MLIAACAAPPSLETAASAPHALPAPPPPRAEEPLPLYWRGAFSMVQAGGTTAGPRQFQLILGRDGPNHFIARRGCYFREGRLLRRSGLWLVEAPEGVRTDPDCPGKRPFVGSPDRLFEHRAITLSVPGPQRWIEEAGIRWIYLQNPSTPPPPERRP